MKFIAGRGSQRSGDFESILVASALMVSRPKGNHQMLQDMRWEALKNEEIRQSAIRRNICPTCDGKLVRGKKSKNNQHKRKWACQTCGEAHYI